MRGFLNFFRALYSLDTLDTRFTTSSTAPVKAKEDGQRKAAPTPLPNAKPSKWSTLEYGFYYLIFLTIVPLMFKAVYDVSNPGSPNWEAYSKRLSPGWIPGRKVDNSDTQYASFRDNVPYMTAVLILHPLLRKVYSVFWRIDTYTQVKQTPEDSRGLTHGLSAAAAADARLEHRVSFDFIFAFVFIAALHGVSAMKVFLILYANYKLATTFPRAQVPIATWVFNIGILFANELGHGYPFATLAKAVLPPSTTSVGNSDPTASWGAWLDSYGGIIPRWEILFNLTVLRLISFNMDYYWSHGRNSASPVEVSTTCHCAFSYRR